MRFSRCLVVVGLAGLSLALPKKSKAPTEVKPTTDLVDVQLTPQSGSVVKVTVTNLGKKKLNLFQRGTLLGKLCQRISEPLLIQRH